MTPPALVPALPARAFQGPTFEGGRGWPPILFFQISLVYGVAATGHNEPKLHRRPVQIFEGPDGIERCPRARGNGRCLRDRERSSKIARSQIDRSSDGDGAHVSVAGLKSFQRPMRCIDAAQKGWPSSAEGKSVLDHRLSESAVCASSRAARSPGWVVLGLRVGLPLPVIDT
jgi:hypothetical protein